AALSPGARADARVPVRLLHVHPDPGDVVPADLVRPAIAVRLLQPGRPDRRGRRRRVLRAHWGVRVRPAHRARPRQAIQPRLRPAALSAVLMRGAVLGTALVFIFALLALTVHAVTTLGPAILTVL